MTVTNQEQQGEQRCNRCGKQVGERELEEQGRHLDCPERPPLEGDRIPDPVVADDITNAIRNAADILDTLQTLHPDKDAIINQMEMEGYTVQKHKTRYEDPLMEPTINTLTVTGDGWTAEISVQGGDCSVKIAYPYASQQGGWRLFSGRISDWTREASLRRMDEKGFDVDVEDESEDGQQMLTAF